MSLASSVVRVMTDSAAFFVSTVCRVQSSQLSYLVAQGSIQPAELPGSSGCNPAS